MYNASRDTLADRTTENTLLEVVSKVLPLARGVLL